MPSNKTRRRIERLILRTCERGATTSEEDAAARQLGRILMRHPELIGQAAQQRDVTPPQDAGVVRCPPQNPEADPREVLLYYESIMRQTWRAMLLDFGNRQDWIPRSQIISAESHIIRMKRWFARRAGLIS